MEKPEFPGTGLKITSVILGTLAGGFMWRCRGESGFGSSWGMYSVAVVLLMIIWLFYGKRKGMKYELIPFGAFLAGLGVTGYGTVIDQLAGVVFSDLPYQGEVVYLPVDPVGGAVIISLMAFTLIPLFSFFVISLFSGKDYKLRHYIIMVIIFFGVSYICKATVAHPIMKLINPDQVRYAALGLKDRGFDFSSPMAAYMKHFGQRRWTQEIPFFENYYMSVEHISDFFAVLAIAVYALVAFKDKVTCILSLVIDVFVSAVSTPLSSFISMPFHSGFFENIKVPRIIDQGAGWGFWEFCTGASVGFIIMLCIALIPERIYASEPVDDKGCLIDRVSVSYCFNAFLTVFVFALTPFRAIGLRIGRTFEREGILEDGDALGLVIMIAGTVILSVIFFVKLKKNIIDCRTNAFGITPADFSLTVLPSYLALCFVLYFFTNHCPALHIPFAEINGFSSFIRVMTGPYFAEPSLMFVTAVVFFVIFFASRRKIVAGHTPQRLR